MTDRAHARIRRVKETIYDHKQHRDVTRYRYRIIWVMNGSTVASPLFSSRRHAEYMAIRCGAKLVESEAA